MNLTLGTLRELKAWLLNEELLDDTGFDTAIAQLGRGVAAQFEEHCSRKFARSERSRTIASHLCNLVLNAYPVEGVPVVESSAGCQPADWIPTQDDLEKFHPDSGVVWLSHTDVALRRITWTGGYWLDETVDNTGECPVTATPLPEALRFAWLQQCAHIWGKRQKLGVPVNATLSTAEVTQALLPDVTAVLATYRRYQL